MSSKPVNIVESIPLEDLAYSHDKYSRVEVLTGDSEPVILDTVRSGRVDKDGRASSRASCDVTVFDDGSLDLVPGTPDSELHVYGNEFIVYNGIEYFDRIDLVQLGVFLIETSTIEDTAEGIEISFGGPDRSGRMIEASFENTWTVARDTILSEAIINAAKDADPDIDVSGIPTINIPLPQIVADPGSDRWDFMQKLALSAGYELFFNRYGLLTIRLIPSPISGAPTATITDGEGGTLVSARRQLDRSPIYNKVIIDAENVNEDQPPIRGIAEDRNPNSPTFYGGKFGKKPKFYSNEYIRTQDQADDAATGLLSRVTGAPDNLSFDAFVDPAREPGDIIRLHRERLKIQQQDHILDSVTIPLDIDSDMSCATRVTQEIG